MGARGGSIRNALSSRSAVRAFSGEFPMKSGLGLIEETTP